MRSKSRGVIVTPLAGRSVYAYLIRLIPLYLVALLAFPALSLAVFLASRNAGLPDVVSGTLFLAAVIYGCATCAFVYRKAMVCPACKQHVLGAISKSQFRRFEFFKPLVPTHCRSCAVDLRLLAYSPRALLDSTTDGRRLSGASRDLCLVRARRHPLTYRRQLWACPFACC